MVGWIEARAAAVDEHGVDVRGTDRDLAASRSHGSTRRSGEGANLDRSRATSRISPRIQGLRRETGRVRLQKLHGVGNDFLVLLDGDGDHPIGADRARALCDRHTGIGADGFIRVVRRDEQVVMHLRNADGNVAEMSGNGIRCVGRAARRVGWWVDGDLAVLTVAGLRRLTCRRDGMITVDVGEVKILGREPDGAWRVDVGNPHLVRLLTDASNLADVDLAAEAWADGNVEIVTAGPDTDSVTMRVWERGAGPTLACGTGSCAVAAIAHEAGWTGPIVAVNSPGGTVEVDVTHLAAVRLTGPAVFVADIEVPA